MNITTKVFGQVNGEQIHAYTLENDHGLKMTCINLGCIVTEILTPNADGNMENIVLGFDNPEDYIKYKTYFGTIVGRVAGRIKGAQFELDGTTYQLEANEGANHLHGGLSEKVWNAQTFQKENQVGVEFTYFSPNGEEGYPGNVELKVTYSLNNNNEWIQVISGTTDQKTLLNLTNHSYFNLSGNVKSDVLNHVLKIDSNQFVELNEELLPTGKFLDVDHTAFDLREGRKIKDGVESNHPQNLLAGNGYDHPLLLAKNNDSEIKLTDPESGRVLIVETDQPCVVLYTSNGMGQSNFSVTEGVPAKDYLGVCLETQGLPDAIHHEHFPSIVVEPNGKYQAVTTYRFSVE